MNYSDILWLPLTAGLTILGFLLTYVVYRRRGGRAAMLGAAWSLLPIAAYLTGATEMLWRIGVAVGKFGTAFVFSPEKWAGIGVTGLAVALFLAAGGRQRRREAREGRRARRAERAGEQAAAEGRTERAGLGAPNRTRGLATRDTARTPVPADRTPARSARRAPAPADDDDMKDIEDILRKRGL